jgi:hypothetical protein
MSKRLQVLLDEAELREIQRLARRKRVTVADWVREALRAARRSEGARAPGRKLEAIRQAVRHRYPAGDVDQMLREIERGYLDSGRS